MQANDKQQFVSDLWLDRAKDIYTVDDKFNLTALKEGKRKHDAEVAYLRGLNLIQQHTTLLDLACGNGRLAEEFAQDVAWFTGTDLCDDFIIALNQWKKEQSQQNIDFFSLDLLSPDYQAILTRQYSLIFLFGLTQIIIADHDLLRILKNTKKLLIPDGHLLIKQTTSIDADDIHVDHFSDELQQRWVAHYRTENTMKALCAQVGLKVLSCDPIYSIESLGEHYRKVERWDNSRQMIFDIVHAG